MIALPGRPKILVVALRRLGDVLLTTPLVRSLRRAWPDAQIDMLVFADTAGILHGNPDISNVIVIPVRPGLTDSLGSALKTARRYDLAISTQTGDRPTILAVLAGHLSVGPVSGSNLMSRLKSRMLNVRVSAESGIHRVEEMLRLGDAIGIERVAETVAPVEEEPAVPLPASPYAVLHPAPMFHYKRWHDSGWREIARDLLRRGLQVVVTGGPAAEERGYLDGLFEGDAGVQRVDGRRSWPQLTTLLSQAFVFVGPDTSVTHLAAAAGAPTVALFGPTDPRLWGPWPAGGLNEPWQAAGTIQRRNNVWLVQNPLPCLPCQQEGCDRHIRSHSQCLDELEVRQVLAAVDQALGNHAVQSSEPVQSPLER